MSTSKSFIIASLFILLSSAVHAQKTIDTQTNAWYMYFGNHRISEQWGIHTEYQWRRSGLIEKWQQSLLRVGADYYTKSGLQLSAGYGWIVSFPYGEQPIAYKFPEHRIWQQLIMNQKTGRLYFNHRYRLEQRWLRNKVPHGEHGYDNAGFNYRNRARYRFLVTVPLTNPELVDNTLFLAVYDEVFLGFGKGIGKNVLDQNRLFAALGWRFNKNMNVIKPDGERMERNHTLQLAFTYNLDFRGE